MSLWRMAWRNVWRHRRRSLTTIIGMTLALFATIQYSGLVTGYIASLEAKVLDIEMGDMQVHAVGYRRNPSVHLRMDDSAAIVEALEKAGLHASPRLMGSGLAAAKDNSAGVQIQGIDIARDAKVSKVFQRIHAGKWLAADDPKGVVVGKLLARNLEVSVGSELILLSQAADGSSANDIYKVRGVLGTVGGAIDRGGVLLTEGAFRELLVVPQGAHRIVIRRPLGGDAQRFATPALVRAAAVDAVGKHELLAWRELVPTLAQMLDTSRAAMGMMFMIVYIAIAIVVLNTMLMAVFERIREFGMLKAIGMGPLTVIQLVLLECFSQVGIAILLAVSISVPVLWYLSTVGINLMGGTTEVMGVTIDEIWKSDFSANTFVQPIVMMVFVVGAAVVYPALKAALVRPVEAIRYR